MALLAKVNEKVSVQPLIGRLSLPRPSYPLGPFVRVTLPSDELTDSSAETHDREA